LKVQALKGRGKSKREQRTKQHEKPVHLYEECNEQHFKILSKLHDEVQPRHEEMRTRLNSLKKRGSMKKKTPETFDDSMLPKSWLVARQASCFCCPSLRCAKFVKDNQTNHT